MKKTLITLLALAGAASVHAQATGPLYLTYPGFCNIKRIFVTNTGNIFGTEVGCAATIGAPVIGYVNAFGEVPLSAVEANGTACMHVFRTDGFARGACSSNDVIGPTQQTAYIVSAVKPPQAVRSSLPGIETKQ